MLKKQVELPSIINESLTKANKEVSNAASSFNRRFHYKYVWTNDGLPYLKKDEDHQATIIRRFEDLPSDGKGKRKEQDRLNLVCNFTLNNCNVSVLK